MYRLVELEPVDPLAATLVRVPLFARVEASVRVFDGVDAGTEWYRAVDYDFLSFHRTTSELLRDEILKTNLTVYPPTRSRQLMQLLNFIRV